MFIGRKDELEELNARFDSGRFEMGVIYGSRRIGKTALLSEFAKDKPSFYFQAKKSTELDNRKAFSELINKLIGVPYTFVYPSYSDGFDALLKYAGGKAFIIIIDEIAFIGQSDKGFLSELQYNIDHKFRNLPIKLLLSGSTISFMKEILEDKRGPLFQRSTFQINVKKMLYSDALAFLDGISAEDKIRYLAVFGEHPFYLEMIDKSKSFNDNIYSLLFSRFGTLIDAPDKVLPTASKDQGTYNTILKAIAKRRRTNKEIADYIGKDANYTAVYLPKMTDNQIIEKRESFNRNQKMNYYEISDNLLRFWYAFIFDNLGLIQQGMGKALFEELKDEIDLFISTGFESAAISYLTEQNIRGKLGANYDIIREYKADNSSLGHSVEFDGLARGLGKNSGKLLVAECKYRNKALSLSVLEHLLENLKIFDADSYEIYLFSKSGFADDIRGQEPDGVHLISINDMTSAIKNDIIKTE